MLGTKNEFACFSINVCVVTKFSIFPVKEYAIFSYIFSNVYIANMGKSRFFQDLYLCMSKNI